MSAIPTRDEVLTVVKRQLLELIDDLTEEEVDPQRPLMDLAVSSLDIVEVVSRSMRELNVRIPRADLAIPAYLENLNELADALHAAIVRAAAAPPSAP